MPIFGFITAGMDFNKLKLVMSPAEIAADGTVQKAEAAILYGTFIENLIDFFLISISIFFMIKLLSKFKRKQEEVPQAEPVKEPTEVEILTEIRDLLEEKNK